MVFIIHNKYVVFHSETARGSEPYEFGSYDSLLKNINKIKERYKPNTVEYLDPTD